ncbi:hypothetical protein NI17_004490 [Thermobifida halotolerans]|uniref:Uncharacterized protein n=1 Tax=Thermobifida halotolerans TaxID=483545 RepID=A0A399G221_9ACTN|nr:hypothetical protein [Thermobifida halotolerans]UOE20492.1 hypothetical protein NI17_004490 [Thermobifida halotolerans]
MRHTRERDERGRGGRGRGGGRGWGLLRADVPFRVLLCSRTASLLGESVALVALLLRRRT